MGIIKMIYLLLLLGVRADDPSACGYDAERDEFPGGKFPDGFIWSLATASYQIEGSWDQDGKGENIWDNYSHNKNSMGECNIKNCDSGDVACDSYEQTARDIEQMTKMGIKNYRFSLSWSRILPTGTTRNGGKVNQAGIDHYSKFIDDLMAAGITPIVTLYHWDLPQALQAEYEGWLGDQIVEDFGEYARLCFASFGDRVKFWITLNESEVVADLGYGIAVMAPGISGRQWEARHNTVRAHSKAYHVYNNEFKAEQKGQIGITMNTDWYEPKSDSAEDKAAAQQMMDFQLGYWADPIYKTGDYPESVKRIMGDELPKFTEEEKALNLNSADFFGLNHYTSSLYSQGDGVDEIIGEKCPNWPVSGSEWLFSVPWGFRRLLKYIHDTYDSNTYPIYVTENGISSAGNGTDHAPELNDQWRINHYHQYIGQMHRAISEDGVNIKAYTAWSLMDNFEWSMGYSERFGLIWVNFTDPEREVFWKDSANFYKQLAESNTVDGSGNNGDTTTAGSTTTSGAFVPGMSLVMLALYYIHLLL